MRNSVILLLAFAIIFVNASTGAPAYLLKCDAELYEEFYSGGCNCAQGAYRMYDGLCRPCPAGTSYYAPSRVCASVCTNGAVWSNSDKKCLCPSDQFNVAGVCIKCARNELFDPTIQRCKPVCNAGYVYDLRINKCRV